MKKKLFFLFVLVAAFSSCGKKGPLVLEPKNTPPAVENFHARQIGGQIELAWNFPASLGDKREAFELSWVSKVTVYHENLEPGEAPPADAFIKKAGVLAKLKAEEIKGLSQNSPSCRFTFKNRDLLSKIHGFSVVYQYARKSSAPAAPLTLKTMLTPPPIQDLQASRQGKTVTLSWSRPAAADKERGLPEISGYHVYRRINGAGGETDFRLINAATVINEFFHDLDTGTDGEYEYQVSCRLDEHVENAPSNPVKVRIQDTFPPDIPGNLVSFTAKDQVFLTWEKVPDTDLAFYRVYRKSVEKEDFTLLADALSDNFFRDKQVVHGKTYIYAITAVDRKGNESDFSSPARQFFE
jgi:fibronectin type 3 domain-containing protein/predicted small lipoprotein YifL